MVPRFLTLLTGRNLPKIRQQLAPELSTVNQKTVADFARVVDRIGILKPDAPPQDPRDGD
jgi:hypothetical protein